MKKHKKTLNFKKLLPLFLGLGSTLFAIPLSLSIVSCSNDSPPPPPPAEEVKYYQVEKNVKNTYVQKSKWGDRELTKEQTNFTFDFNLDKKTCIINSYFDENWNYYDAKLDNFEHSKSDQDICAPESNTLLIPSQVMYKGDWYKVVGLGRCKNGVYQSGNPNYEGNFQILRSINSNLMSIKVAPDYEGLCFSTAFLQDTNVKSSLLISMENFPLSYFLDDYDAKFYNSRQAFYYNYEYLDSLQGDLAIKLNAKNSVFKKLTWNNSYPKDKEVLMPSLKIPTIQEFDVPNVITEYSYGQFIKFNNDLITFPENILKVEYGAFPRDFPASRIPIKYTVKDNEIIEDAYYSYVIDDNFEFPKNIKKIGNGAFSYVRILTSDNNFVIPEGVEILGKSSFVFAGDNPTFYLPDSLKEIYYDGKDENFPFFYYYENSKPSFVVKSERVKNLLIESAHKSGIMDFEKIIKITVDPNY